MNIVVVESPAKAKTINKYLGSGYEVFASFGHVRDLPAKDGSVDPEHDFRMIWEVDAKSQKRLNDIANAIRADGYPFGGVKQTPTDAKCDSNKAMGLDPAVGTPVSKATPVSIVVCKKP